MSVDELCNLGVFDLAQLYRRGEVSPVEVITAHVQRCERLNPALNAFLTLLPDSAIQAAGAMEALFRAGIDLGPLQGVPVSVKDLIRLRGTRTTAASRVLLQEPMDQSDAPVVQRLKAAGAIIIGKTNLHEFASGEPDPAGPFGLVQNPRRIGYDPGGSSSGAAASSASGLGVIAIGTDSGGSVRTPAYLCGVVGLKPTTGRISLEGIIPLSSTLDTVGPLARRVSDVVVALKVCAGHSLTNTSVIDQSMTHLVNQLGKTVRNWRVGIPKGGFFSKMQPDVEAGFENTLELLHGLGCQLIDFNPPEIESMNSLVVSIIRSECSAYHERYRGHEHLYGTNFRERIFLGREIKALDYIAARQQQLELGQKWLKLINALDVLIMPSGPAVAPPHGVNTIEFLGESFPSWELLGLFNRPFNLLGWPSLTVPNGINALGLPTGVQIVGPPDSEAYLLILGQQIEQALGLTAKLGIEPQYPMRNSSKITKS